MKRRHEEASQRSNKPRHHFRDENESDDDVEPTNVVVAGGPSDSDEEEKDENNDGDEDTEVLDFTQTDYAVQMSQAELAEDDDDYEGTSKRTNKEPTKPKVLHKLSDKALDELMAKLVRYMLYKGGLKLPIKLADISKDVFPQYKNVSRYFFFYAKQKLENVFGLRVVKVQDNSSKELYLVLNNATSQEHLLLMNKTGKAASRGFLMMVLGLLWCAPARRLSEDDLWKQLIRLDPKVKLKVNHPLLGDIPLLFKTFESQLYLDATSELDPDLKKIKYYQYGPRTLLEIRHYIYKHIVHVIAGHRASSIRAFRTKKIHVMESLVAAYASSSESSDASSVSSDIESTTASKLHGEENEQIGTNSHEPQWKRAFPHVNGNWPSHVRVNVPVDMKLRELARNAIKRAQEIVGDMVPLVAFEELRLDKCSATGENDALHLSLSRPFVLTYDQINLFVDSLRAALKWRQRFSVTLRRTLVLVNDDKTRSFLALRAVEGEIDFVKVLHCVDQCLTRFKQPTYYKNPIPHISIASSMGEDLAQLTMDQCESLLTPQPEKRQTQFLTIDVTAVHVAIGNKHYNIPLR